MDILAEDMSAPPVEEEPEPTLKGYRMLSRGEIAWMNTVKEAEAQLGATFKNVYELANVDRNLADAARQQFEIGFMLLNRSIAKPENPFA